MIDLKPNSSRAVRLLRSSVGHLRKASVPTAKVPLTLQAHENETCEGLCD
jgi:hypothetical protein